MKRSDSSPNLRGSKSAKAGFEAQPFPENIFTDFAEEQMKVLRDFGENFLTLGSPLSAGASQLPGDPEEITSRPAS